MIVPDWKPDTAFPITVRIPVEIAQVSGGRGIIITSPSMPIPESLTIWMKHDLRYAGYFRS